MSMVERSRINRVIKMGQINYLEFRIRLPGRVRVFPLHLFEYPVVLNLVPIFSDTYLWELDLSQKFNVSKAPWTTHTKPDDWNQYYNGASGTLWNIGDGKFYTLGGKFGSMEGPPPGQRILEPYYTQNTSGYYFQLPDPRVFAFDPQTGNWSSELLPQGVHRVYDAAYTQSARNQVGYTFGGTRVKEKQFSNTEFFAQINDGDWLDSMAAYDFRTGKFNFTTMPDSVGQTKLAMMHSLDRVGNEGVLVAFAGRSSKNNVVQTVSFLFSTLASERGQS